MVKRPKRGGQGPWEEREREREREREMDREREKGKEKRGAWEVGIGRGEM